jgi:hypothetical protein
MIEIITNLQIDEQKLNKPVDTYILKIKANDNCILTFNQSTPSSVVLDDWDNIDQDDFERIYQEYLDSGMHFKDDSDNTQIINSSNK